MLEVNMLEKGKINAGEFLVIVTTFTIGSAILVAPAPLANQAKQDAWIAYTVTVLISISFIFLYNQLASLYPSMTYVEYTVKIFGKWIGKIIALLYLFYIYHIAAAALREIGDFCTTTILVETPIQMIIIIFLLTSLIAVRLGLEVICRSTVIFFPWIIMLLFILFLFLMPQIKLVNIEPVFGEGLKPIIRGAYHNLTLPFLEFSVFLMITPYVTDQAKMKKSFYKGALIGGFIITIVVAFSLLVLGADLTARQAYPTYMLGKKIKIGTFLQRIEVIVAIIWMLTLYFKLTICYYGVSLGLAQVLGLKNYQILLFPLAFLLIPFSILSYPNIVYFENYVAQTLPQFSLTIGLIFPLLLLVIGKVKTRSTSKTTKQPVN
jgi:spore germination protein KB